MARLLCYSRTGSPGNWGQSGFFFFFFYQGTWDRSAPILFVKPNLFKPNRQQDGPPFSLKLPITEVFPQPGAFRMRDIPEFLQYTLRKIPLQQVQAGCLNESSWVSFSFMTRIYLFSCMWLKTGYWKRRSGCLKWIKNRNSFSREHSDLRTIKYC